MRTGMDEYNGITDVYRPLRAVKVGPRLRHSRKYQKKLSPPSPNGS